MPEVAARGLVVERGGVEALAGVDLDIGAGELVAVMGGTGAGKSTLALVLAGLLVPSRGHVGGAAAGQVRVVLQRPEATFLAETVLDEVALAPQARGEPAAVARRHAAAWLELMGLDAELAARDPLALSGGEQRRVAVAATLAAEARVLVLDEPSAGLDRGARARLHAAIAQLHAAGRTIVLVTHDPDESASLATRLVVLREGRLAWDGSVGTVLGDPGHARRLGLRAAPEVELLHEVAAARGAVVEGAPASAAAAVAQLARVVRAHASGAADQRAPGVPGADVHDRPAGSRAPLPPLVDARARVLATALAVFAALAARSLLGAAVVLVATALVVALARVDRVRLRLAVRPLVLLAVMLVLLQLVFGGGSGVELRRGVDAQLAVAPALLRALQAAAVVLATLALSARTTTLDLAAAMRRLLAPLRIVGIPVAALAFVAATGLGLVPAMADELERLRLAQRARGLRAHRAPLAARLRADAALTAPLFVAAFRRAHLLADALAVRGIDPRRPPVAWRPMVVPAVDLLLLAAGIALAFVARFA